MSKRAVAILLAAFVVLLVLVVVGQRSGSSPAGTGAPLIAGLADALGDIERVTVTKANGETVATLEKRPDNWVVSDKHGYVANASKLRQALTALGEARVLEQKTANPELYGRLGVEDVTAADAAGISVALTAPGRELPTVILGNAEGAKYRYARRAGETQSYLIDRNPDVPARRGAMGRLGDRGRPRRARPRGHDHACRRRGRAHLEDRPRARELRSRRRAERPRAVVSRRRQRRRQRVARAESRGRRARRRRTGRAADDRRVSNVRRPRRASDRHRAQRRELDHARGQRRRGASGRAPPPPAAAPAADAATPASRPRPIRTRRRRGSTPKSAVGATRSRASSTTR